MVDYFALALSHSLLLFAAWRLLWRDDLDCDPVRDPAKEQSGPDQGEMPARRPQRLRTRA